MSVYVVDVCGGAEFQAEKVISKFMKKTGFVAIRAIHVITKEVQKIKDDKIETHLKVLTTGYIYLEVDDDAQPTNPSMKLTDELYYFIKSINDIFPRVKRLDLDKKMTNKEFSQFLRRAQGDTEVQIEITTEQEEMEKEMTHTVNTTNNRKKKKAGFFALDQMYISALHRVWDGIKAILSDSENAFFIRQPNKAIFSCTLTALKRAVSLFQKGPLKKIMSRHPAFSIIFASLDSNSQNKQRRGDLCENNDVSDREAQLR